MSKILFITLYDVDYIGTRLLAAYLEQNGHNTHNIHFKALSTTVSPNVVEEHHGFQLLSHGSILIFGIDANPATNKELDLLKESILAYNPDIIGLSAYITHKALLPQLMPILTSFSPKTLLVAGGFGPSLEPDFFLNAGFNVVIKGEGEEPLLELANTYTDTEKRLKIPNTIWRTAQGNKDNPVQAMCRNISLYPSPLFGDSYFSYIDNDELYSNFDKGKNKRKYTTMLGRGCVGRCTYCNGGQLAKSYKDAGHPIIKRRNRSLESVFKELKSLNKKDYDFIEFPDDIYSTTNDKLIEFFTWYKKEIKLPFFMYLYYDQMIKNPDILKLAIDAGLYSVGIGIQTGSEEFSRKYYHRYYSNKTFIDYAKILFDNNVRLEIHFISGNCYETEEDFRKTINLIRKLPFSITNPAAAEMIVFRFKPLPKTPILEMCPKLLTNPMPAKEWFRRAILMQLARLVPESTFEELFANKHYYENPLDLQAFYFSELNKLQITYYKNLLEKWRGKRIAFYGAVDVLLTNYIFFKQFQPECFLLDKQNMIKKKRLFKFPIYDLEEFVPNNKDVHFICFSAVDAAWLKRNLVQMGIPKDQIDVCGCEF